MSIEYFLDQNLDQQGLPEEFIRDTSLLFPRGTTDHLSEDGLPPVGSNVYPGMLLICKIGATKLYRREALPQDLERWSEDEETLISKYKHMFYDGSFYVPEGVYGRVTEAFIEPHGQFKRAIVRIEKKADEQGRNEHC